MKASVIRSALEGHGWIGLFIAIPLFVVLGWFINVILSRD